MPTHLEKQILATIVYYDILDYPLTGLEVFLYLVTGNGEIEDKTEDRKWSSPEASGLDHFLSSVLSLLNSSEYLKKYLEEKKGFYFLKKRKRGFHSPDRAMESRMQDLHMRCHSSAETMAPSMDIVQLRLNRKKIWDQKWKKARKIFWIMQVVPFAKLVMGSGSFSLGNTRKDSDVDLLIIAKKGRIWTVRTFFTLLTSFLVKMYLKFT